LEQQVQEAEAARLLEEQKYVEEKARLRREREEQEARLAEQRRLDEEATRQAELERQRLQEERELLEAKLKQEQKLEEEARMKYEETNRQLDEALKNNEKVQSMDSGDTQEEEEEVSDPIIVPQSSYMSAVARTWVERSAYLDSLQQGKTKGVLPEPPTEPLERVTMPKRRPKQPPAFLVNSIWKFINDGKQSATDLYARNLIKQADEMIAVSVH
jgi:hypothetical protein